MATKHIRKTKSKPAQASEPKAKANSKPLKPSQASDSKTKATARDADGKSTKTAASSRRKPDEKSGKKTKVTSQKAEPASKTKTSKRKVSASHKDGARTHESNGRLAEHGGATTASKRGKELTPAAATTPGTPRKAVRSPQAEQVFLRLFEALDAHAKSQRIGHVAQDPQFDWGEAGNQELNPDLAFVSFDRWAPYRHVPKELPWHVVPDLVVEIVRGSEHTEPISTWLEHYFQAGVNRVWVVYPDQLKIHDHDSLASSRVINSDQTLDGGSILPGFQMSVKALIGREDG
jgi:hypothetical protein